MDLMDSQVYTRTRAHTMRWRTRARLGRVRACGVSVSAGRRSWRCTCGSEREWSGGCLFFSTHASRLAPRPLRSQPALIGNLFPPLFIIVSTASPVSFDFAAKQNFGVGWGVCNTHARTHTRARKFCTGVIFTRMFVQNGCFFCLFVFVQNSHPITPITPLLE